ncbi:DUF742 domain-containing protein [Streptomyces daliensis]|uniref:DUF742 domain-containing protein n=1 Tax=Streptomyces daliensis TaxID=299421 RepID=A0A8T4IZ89_9ACTN|nr:DUF742 domain-containing protein [Streptomyces daliensis]
MKDRWFDDAAGPVVRPYAMTRGRTRSSTGQHRLDLIALVIAESPDGAADAAGADSTDGAPGAHPNGNGTGPYGDTGFPYGDEDPYGDDLPYGDADLHAYRTLAPEHLDIVKLCRASPQSVAELAAELDLPVGVVRVLIGDLIDAELVRVSRPVPPAELPDESILREVINGLRAL